MMPALNFQARFAPLVESGEKRQTIRKVRKRRPIKVGDTLHLWTGQRLPEVDPRRKFLGHATCTEVIPVRIPNFGWISLNGGPVLPTWGATALAQADGFTTAGEMIEWFAETHGLPFRGVVIRWQAAEAAKRGDNA